jgi:hypothetical protein
LSAQQQIILDAIALKWDAIALNELSITTRMQNNQLSPQLKRLIDDGWLGTTPAYESKGNAYYINERFFNIYYIIRNSSRRHKDKIYCLSKFLEYFYRDKLEEMDKATELLNSITEEELIINKNNEYLSLFYLEKTLFELYKRNEGLAKEYLFQSFEIIEREDALPFMANENRWTRFANIVIMLDYSSWLISVLEEKGYDIKLSPYYTAIKALEIEQKDSKNGNKDAEIYLKNRAIEISSPARVIIDKIKSVS